MNGETPEGESRYYAVGGTVTNCRVSHTRMVMAGTMRGRGAIA
jgi:hypothetical protein